MQIRSHLARRLAVGAAVLAALTMGPLALTGQAGAATVTAPSTSHATSTNHAKSSVPAVCSGGKSRFKLRQTGKGFDKRALKFEARAAKAKAAGHTKRAAWFAKIGRHIPGQRLPPGQALRQDGKPQIGIRSQGVRRPLISAASLVSAASRVNTA